MDLLEDLGTYWNKQFYSLEEYLANNLNSNKKKQTSSNLLALIIPQVIRAKREKNHLVMT